MDQKGGWYMDSMLSSVPTVEKKENKRGRPLTAIQLARPRTNSAGSIQDFFKRKWEANDKAKAEEVLLNEFEKVKKIHRSPKMKEEQELESRHESESEESEEMGIKEQMKKLVSLMTDLKNDNRDMKAENGRMREEIRKVKEEMKRKDKERKEVKHRVYERIETLEEETRDTRAALKRMENGEKESERRKRKGHILVRGLKADETGVTTRSVEEFLARELQIQAKVTDAFWNKNHRKGMIVAKPKHWETKHKILRKKSQLGNKKIYIDNDLTHKERKIQMQIGDIAKEEKLTMRGNTTEIGYKKLTINRKKNKWIEGEGLQGIKFQDEEDRRDTNQSQMEPMESVSGEAL